MFTQKELNLRQRR
jgi:hypothetical protein